MSGLGRPSSYKRPADQSMVHEARVAVTAVDRALRSGDLAGPAEAYHAMGSLSLLTRTLQRSLGELAVWLREAERDRQLSVVEGPFVDAPDAAVDVAVQSLLQASRACQWVFDALERAHISMAHVGAHVGAHEGAHRGPTRRRARRVARRRRGI